MSGYNSIVTSGYADGYVGSSEAINSVVEAFVASNSITNTTEISALNTLYVGVASVIDTHGSGSILYLNGISPTSIAAAREAIVYGAGNQTAVDIGIAPTHSANGIKFNGTTQAWNIGGYQNNHPRREILQCFGRNNSITVNGVQLGEFTSGTNYLLKLQNTAGTSGYTSNGYPSYDFQMKGVFIGYRDAGNALIFKDGILQTNTLGAPDATVSGTGDFYLCARNKSGVADKFTDDEIGCVLSLWDGGTMFTTSQIQEVNDLVYNYNKTLGRTGFTAKKQIIMDGNSLIKRSEGNLETAFDTEYGAGTYDIINVAVSGSTADNGRTRQNALMIPYLSNNREVIYVAQWGRNSLAPTVGGDTVAATLADIKSIYSKNHTKMTACKNIAILTSASDDGLGSTMTDIPLLNADIVADVSGDFDQIYDLYNNGEGFDDETNQPPFDADAVHYSNPVGEDTQSEWIAGQVATNNP